MNNEKIKSGWTFSKNGDVYTFKNNGTILDKLFPLAESNTEMSVSESFDLIRLALGVNPVQRPLVEPNVSIETIQSFNALFGREEPKTWRNTPPEEWTQEMADQHLRDTDPTLYALLLLQEEGGVK